MVPTVIGPHITAVWRTKTGDPSAAEAGRWELEHYATGYAGQLADPDADPAVARAAIRGMWDVAALHTSPGRVEAWLKPSDSADVWEMIGGLARRLTPPSSVLVIGLAVTIHVDDNDLDAVSAWAQALDLPDPELWGPIHWSPTPWRAYRAVRQDDTGDETRVWCLSRHLEPESWTDQMEVPAAHLQVGWRHNGHQVASIVREDRGRLRVAYLDGSVDAVVPSGGMASVQIQIPVQADGWTETVVLPAEVVADSCADGGWRACVPGGRLMEIVAVTGPCIRDECLDYGCIGVMHLGAANATPLAVHLAAGQAVQVQIPQAGES